MPAEQIPEFQAAVTGSRKLKQKPTNDELLELYSLYKQGIQDPVFADAPAPGMFDLKGKAKYNAWKKLVDEGVSAEEAQRRYVELVNALKEKYGAEE